MTRARIGRRGAGLMAAALVALQLSSGMVSAGETRLLTLTWSGNTLVTTGGQTTATLTITNTGGQNLSHVLVGVGTSPAAGPLPGTVTILDVIGSDFATYCSKTSSTISCDFGSMAAKGPSKTHSFQVIFSVSAAGTLTVPTGASVNESGNPNGSNTQVFPGDLGLVVSAPTCDLAATYFAPGQASKIIGDDSGCPVNSTSNKQTTNVKVVGNVVSTIVVQETDSDLCQAGYTCFGQLSIGDMSVNDGYQMLWTIQWNVPSNFNLAQFGVIHFKDGNVFDFAITNKSKNYCKTDTSTGCFMGAPTLVGTTLTAVVSTSGNLGIKGFN